MRDDLVIRHRLGGLAEVAQHEHHDMVAPRGIAR